MAAPEHSFKDIKASPGNYSWYRACGCFNLRENNSCHNCGSIDLSVDLEVKLQEEEEFQVYGNGLTEECFGDVYFTVS